MTNSHPESLRRRAGRYLFGVGVLSICGAIYFIEWWHAALWLASIGIILAFVGGIVQAF